ncbi:MAG: hypothetical protein COS84_08525 [Armatimonadetes bacterium CG07_land_8_20_14_0_80_40_9]|nr:MAG: hypothetical protein COS84_08525 [Armatimonadetes bacterium CG07_land_8_20_14_0_80_40_9]
MAEKGEKEVTLERLLTIGAGALTMTKEKAKEIVEEWEEKGEIRRKDAKKYVNDLVKKGQKERDELRKTIDKSVGEITKRIGIVTKADLKKITDKLEKLEKKLKR